MKILIVAATKPEIISKVILSNNILITGVGMVNTAINLTKELMQKRYDIVINIGIAGSFNKELRNGFVVEVIEDNFSELGFEDDLSFSKFTDFDIKTKFNLKGQTELKKVRGITVNTVHGDTTSISEIIKREDPDIETMEGAAVLKVCEEFDVSCLQIRSISNKVEVRNKSKWDIDLAIRNLNIEVEKLINNL
tara:strand:+ start:10401 stop:10979 length:579 start_codon:yes stop_codon:yes gene_type:complete